MRRLIPCTKLALGKRRQRASIWLSIARDLFLRRGRWPGERDGAFGRRGPRKARRACVSSAAATAGKGVCPDGSNDRPFARSTFGAAAPPRPTTLAEKQQPLREDQLHRKVIVPDSLSR